MTQSETKKGSLGQIAWTRPRLRAFLALWYYLARSVYKLQYWNSLKMSVLVCRIFSFFPCLSSRSSPHLPLQFFFFLLVKFWLRFCCFFFSLFACYLFTFRLPFALYCFLLTFRTDSRLGKTKWKDCAQTKYFSSHKSKSETTGVYFVTKLTYSIFQELVAMEF